MATSRQYFETLQELRRPKTLLQRFGSVFAAVIAIGLGAGVTVGLEKAGLLSALLDQPAKNLADVSRQRFTICNTSLRVTCVVDGDTFWLEGTKIRIADINTPEVGQPACAEEAALGRQASRRLAELLGEAPFTLVEADRDEDKYGRKLRIVVRDGHSIGHVLVAEGLAHPWEGHRESWC